MFAKEIPNFLRILRRFLRIAVENQGSLRHFQCVVLPFGITTALRIFTKIRVSFHQDNPFALDTLIQWSFNLAYIFPSRPMISRILTKVRQDNASMIVVFPYWLKRAWFLLLLKMSQSTFCRLSLWPVLIFQGDKQLWNSRVFHLTASRLMVPYWELGASQILWFPRWWGPESLQPTRRWPCIRLINQAYIGLNH